FSPACARLSSAPTEVVQTFVVDAVEVGDLVDDGDDDLLAQVVAVLGEVDEVVTVDEDVVGQLETRDAAFADRSSLVAAEQMPVLDEQGDIVQLLCHPRRQQVEGLIEDRLELVIAQGLHALHSSPITVPDVGRRRTENMPETCDRGHSVSFCIRRIGWDKLNVVAHGESEDKLGPHRLEA